MSTQTSWLIFRPLKCPYAKFLKKGFGHIDILQRDKYNWILIRGSWRQLEWKILPYEMDADVPKLLSEKFGVTVLKVESIINKKPRFFPIVWKWFPNCVYFAQYVASIQGTFITPYSLFKSLMKLRNSNKMKYGVTHVDYIF